VLAGTAATVGSALYSANAAGKAQDKALSAQNTATQESLAAQQAALDRITNLQQPFINAGASVLPGIGARVNAGAPNFSAPSYALPQRSAYSTPPSAGGPDAYRQSDNGAPPHVGAVGVPDGSMGTGKLGNGVSIDPASAGPPDTPSVGATPQPVATGPDWIILARARL